MNKLTYSDLSDEDKLLMNELFQYKSKKETERKIIRNILARLRKREMDCTKDIMNLSQRKIGEKFDLGCNSAKPLSKKLLKEIEIGKKSDKEKRFKSGVQGLSFEKQQKVLKKINEKKICSTDGQQSEANSGCFKEYSRSYG